ncbi:hypothetical protein AEA09_04325 [Lysinibacillus contaminans]|uniref:MacB-like periplasmic core domain-containing protein n=1 Tax=Lysinibacillus contaminans TaxID=1293441 RepID=A0ABR5JYZ7_9BACI|nr:hypothetical protein [Lysinibacillus contaminans]KOS67856.1 hypothetical protein AEA09_04325 [Lysinibacillus contaminans]
MKIVSRVIRKQIIQAILIGGVVGLFGVAIFLGVLQASNQISQKKEGESQGVSGDKTVPTAVESSASSMFYASQAGVFSNYESASVFLAEYPTLAEGTIVEVDGKFYVWTSMVIEESKLTFLEKPPTFKKAFSVVSGNCTDAKIAELPVVLADKNAAKFNFQETAKDSTLPADWQTIGTAASKISKDLNIVRLQVFAHYKSKNACLQVKF